MKSIVMPKVVQLSEEMRQQMSQEVKETLATPANVNNTENKKIFTAAEMWNSRRYIRSASSRIHRRISK